MGDFNLDQAIAILPLVKTIAAEIIDQNNDALVVLDVGLPDISGYEVCARIRTDLDASDMPVLMLTAKSSEQDRFSGMVLAYADAYLTKPADPLTLLATAESLIRRRRR